MIDFTQCKVEPTKFYDGLNGKKLAIYFENELYMLKFPKAQNIDGYASSTINEHISSSIFGTLGLETQITKLGFYNNEIVVACKDFEGFSKRLFAFGKVKNSTLECESSFADTDFHKTIEVIEKQQIVNPAELISFYFEMFVADTLVANFDRHNGNWGFLVDNNRNISLAPIYDCGSSLYPKLSLVEIGKNLVHRGTFNDLLLNQTTSAITVNGKKINPLRFLENTTDERLISVLDSVLSRIDEIKIREIINGVEIISQTRKEFYNLVIAERRKMLEKILGNHRKVRKKPVMRH